MFSKLTYKTKNKLLIGALVVFLFAIYQLAIKKTLEMRADCADLEQKIETINTAPEKMAELQKMNSQMDRLLGNSTDTNIQQSLLGIVTNYCHQKNVTLQEFPKPIVNTNKGTTVETNVFTVEGGFSNLLELVYLFEQKYKTGKVVSVHYQVKKEPGASKANLTAQIYLQNIKQTNHES